MVYLVHLILLTVVFDIVLSWSYQSVFPLCHSLNVVNRDNHQNKFSVNDVEKKFSSFTPTSRGITPEKNLRISDSGTFCFLLLNKQRAFCVFGLSAFMLLLNCVALSAHYCNHLIMFMFHLRPQDDCRMTFIAESKVICTQLFRDL